jgi:hypothetical protein
MAKWTWFAIKKKHGCGDQNVSFTYESLLGNIFTNRTSRVEGEHNSPLHRPSTGKIEAKLLLFELTFRKA